MKRYSFSKFHRLQSREFDIVFTQGKRLYTNHLVIGYFPATTPHSKLGFVVSKKKLNKATKRYRFKRHCRESFRLNQHKFDHLSIVITPKKNITGANLVEIESELSIVWQKLTDISC